MSGFVFRDYQLDLVEKIRDAVRRGRKAIVARAPTGAGKTVMFASMASSAQQKGNSTIIYAPRRELVFQTVHKLVKGYRVTPGIIMAGEPMHYDRKVQVASFDTVDARAMRSNKIELPNAKLVIPDEAHLSVAPTRLAILNRHKAQDALIVAFTATPARPDGYPLGRVYEELVEGWTTRQMMNAGYLVRARYICPTQIDLSRLKISKHTGDFDEDELELEFDKPKLIGEIVDNWMMHASDRTTMVFCITQKHARHVLESFIRAGVKAEYVDADTPKSERMGIFSRLDSGETRVLVNVFVATFGVDIPRVGCVVFARPTRSLVLYHQIGGRGLRPVFEREHETASERLAAIACSIKPDLLVIDHVGCVDQHGFLDDDVPWSIDDDGRTVSERKRAKQEEEKAPKELICPGCKSAFSGARNCPTCGFELIKPSEPVPFYSAVLQEVVKDGNDANKRTHIDIKVQFMGEAKGYARNKGYADGWAAWKYKEKFGVFPNDDRIRRAEPREPTQLFTGFMTHLHIKQRFRERR